MSQESNAIAGPSQPHSDNSSLHYHRCWWAWCRHSFYTRRDLLDHISLEHVQKARPERLQDILAHKKREDEYWDSFDNMSSPSLPPNFSRDVEPAPQAEKDHRGQSQLDYMHSSLPSPPASTPHEIPGTPVRIQEPADLLMDTDTPTNHSRLFASPQPSNGLLTPFSKHSAPDTYLSTPTFASLSSQPNTPSGRVYIIPDSPPFNALVQEALKTSKSTNHQTTHHDDDTFDSFRSDGSSQEFVLNQLTQGMDEENNGILQEKSENESMVIDDPPLATSLSSRDNETLAYSRSPPQRNPPAQDNLGLLSPTRPSLQLQTIFTPFAQSDSSPTYLQSPTYSIGLGSPVIRQSWYQAPRRRRSSKKMSGSEAQTSPVQPLVADVTVAPPAEPKPRVLQSEPTITLAASPSSLISEPDQFTPRTQYSWMQSDSQVTGSYPPLQTQAPYRSQSMSQD